MQSVKGHLPKEMLPLGAKSAIQYTVEEGLDAGVEQIVVILNPGKESIREYFTRRGYLITFLYQETPRGEMNAVVLAEEMVRDRALAIYYPDNFYFPAPGALRRLIQVFNEHAMDVVALNSVTEKNAAVLGNAGRVDLCRVTSDLYRIQRFYPKGEGHFKLRFQEELRTCGIMVCGPHIFDAIRRAGKSPSQDELTDRPVLNLLLQERGWLGLRLPGTVYDIGNPEDYHRCVKHVFNGGR
jgi:UTP--glucose-1-phosphate uridylyltransferase